MPPNYLHLSPKCVTLAPVKSERSAKFRLRRRETKKFYWQRQKKTGGFGKQSAQAAISAADEEALANANQLQNSDKFSAQKEVKNIKKETNNFSNREKRK